ncbi:MAG: hypothetical protein ABI604_20345, partial [Nitrospirota bacterium]
SYGAFANFVPPAEEWTSYNNTQGPLWIVAILGDDLTPIIVMHPPPGVEITDDREADGAFYAWDANSGRLMQEGAFIHGAPHSYASLVALPTSNASIASATPWPTEPPITPLPSPTMSQSRLATLVPALTAQAIRYLTATPTP